MNQSIDYAVSGGTPQGDAADYILFDSTVALSAAKVLPLSTIKRMSFAVKNSQAGTLKAFHSTDGGTTWDQYDSQAVAIPAGTAISGPYDYLVDTFRDWRLVWTNGGVLQATWRPVLIGHTDRVSGV